MKSTPFVLRVLSQLLLLFSISFFLKSCRCTIYYQLTGHLEMTAYPLLDNWSALDTIQQPFRIDCFFEFEDVSYWKNPDLMSSAWAFSCEEIFVNPVDPETVHLSFARKFYIDSEVIDSGFNLMDIPDINFDASYVEYCSIKFDSTFMKKASFEKGIYNFEFQAMTYDSLPLHHEISLFMNWQ